MFAVWEEIKIFIGSSSTTAFDVVRQSHTIANRRVMMMTIDINLKTYSIFVWWIYHPSYSFMRLIEGRTHKCVNLLLRSHRLVRQKRKHESRQSSEREIKINAKSCKLHKTSNFLCCCGALIVDREKKFAMWAERVAEIKVNKKETMKVKMKELHCFALGRARVELKQSALFSGLWVTRRNVRLKVA